MIRDSNKMKYNPLFIYLFFLLRWRKHKEQKEEYKHWKT
jgi:hypothetical protein